MINGFNGFPSIGSHVNLEQLIDNFDGQVEPLLEFEELTERIKNNNEKVLDFIKSKSHILIK